MNRRDFLKTSTVATGALFFASFVIAKPTPRISWEDFDWMVYPSEMAFRYEIKNGKHVLNSCPYYCKTQKTKLVCYGEGPDLTQETKRIVRKLELPSRIDGKPYVLDLSYTVCTNETLLLEAQKMGFTHIYMFVRTPYIITPDWQKQYSYCIRGAKLPNWKTNRGKLQVVNI